MEINVKSLSYEDRVQLLKQLIDSFTDVKVTARCCEYEHIINDEYVFTDSNHNIIIGKCWQAKTVISETTLTPQP